MFYINECVLFDASIPPPAFPPASRFISVAGDAVGIAIVVFTINISMAKLFAKKHSYHLDSNQVSAVVDFSVSVVIEQRQCIVA